MEAAIQGLVTLVRSPSEFQSLPCSERVESVVGLAATTVVSSITGAFAVVAAVVTAAAAGAAATGAATAGAAA